MKPWSKDLLLLFLGIFLFLGISLPFLPIHSPDGGRYAEIPREMVVSGDYVTPHLNGIKYFEKPPLFYWMQTVSMKLLGFNEVAAGLMNVLCAVGCVLLIYLAGYYFYDRVTGWLAAIILATSSLFFALTKIVTLDVALTFFITASLLCFIRAVQEPYTKENNKYWYLVYLFGGLAVLTKGLIGLLFLGMIVGLWVILNNDWKKLSKYHIFSGSLLFLAVTLPWHILVQLRNPEFFNFYFIEQHFLRYFTNYADRYHSNWFFILLLIPCFLPWSVFLFRAVTKSKFSSLEKFWWIWVISIIAFFSFSHSKLIPYLLPVFPPLSLLVAIYLRKNAETKGVRFGFISLSCFCVILAIALIVLAHKILAGIPFITFSSIQRMSIGLGVAGIILAWFSFYKKNFWASFIITTAIFTGLELNIQKYLPIINDKSVRDVALKLKEELLSTDEVISYREYYQDLPYYLNQTVTVADFVGEINWGVTYQPEAKEWIINREITANRWIKKPVYIVCKKRQFLEFAEQFNLKGWRIIAEDEVGHVVITNKGANGLLEDKVK